MFLSSVSLPVDCPICGVSVDSKNINNHIDTCLKSDDTGNSSIANQGSYGSSCPTTTTRPRPSSPPASKKPRIEIRSENVTRPRPNNKWDSLFRKPQLNRVSLHQDKAKKKSKCSQDKQNCEEAIKIKIAKDAPNCQEDANDTMPRPTTTPTSTTSSVTRRPQNTSKLQFKPLAEMLRPADLEEYIGQINAIGQNSIFRTLLETDQVPSCILWGPPGCGKTSLANVIANRAKKSGKLRFIKLSATCSNLSEVKNVITTAKNEQNMFKKKTILFIDEIHRFNKLQQDTFLPHVENGTITLIGATTENPSFRINSALLSRCRIVILEKLSKKNLEQILERGASELGIELVEDNQDAQSSNMCLTRQALTGIALYCDGDARTALNTLQLIADAVKSNKQSDVAFESNHHTKSSVIDMEMVKNILQRSHVMYDRTGDEHYNCISALVKSMRGSDANAALYWLGRMMLGGEDPLFVARRLIVFASEDVGLANNQALPLAVATYNACHYIGMPECQINLSHCVVYLAKTTKSTESYMAYNRVKVHIENYQGSLPGVPVHLRNTSINLMKNLSEKYNQAAGQQTYLPENIASIDFFKDNKSRCSTL